MKKTFETLRGIEIANTDYFWGAFWKDPSMLMKAVIETRYSGFMINYVEKNDMAICVSVANLNLFEVNEMHKLLKDFADQLTKVGANPKLYTFKVSAVMQDNSFVKFTLNY